MSTPLDHEHRASLERRDDDDATRELVELLIHGDSWMQTETAQALLRRVLPEDVRARVAALILDDTLDRAEGVLAHPLRLAARALLDPPTEEAFALVAPLLQVGASWRSFDRLRADELVHALEKALARRAIAPGKETWIPDARFRPLCEQLQRSDPDLSTVAAQAIAGFRYFDGEDVEPLARTVNLSGEDEPPFPFLIAGFPVETGEQRRAIDAALPALARDRPPGLAWFEHQYGGYACLQAQILGYGVVAPRAPRLVDALAALVKAWDCTFGEPMTPPDLLEWSGRLAGLLPPEGVESGAEALLVSPPCAPIETLLGQDIFLFESAPWHDTIDVGMEPGCISTPDWYYGNRERLLMRLGEALGLGRPRVALLWGNSD